MSETGELIASTVDGQQREVVTAPARPVLDVLREDLALTGTKEGLTAGCSVEEMDEAFAQAAHVLERTFRTPCQHQGYIEHRW